MIDYFLMELTIKNKYINPEKCKYDIRYKTLCPFHEFIDPVPRSTSCEIETLHKIIIFIQNHFRKSVPLFWQSFDELSSWRTLSNISLVFHIIWLLNACANWIIAKQDEEYNELQIGKLQMKIFNSLTEEGFGIDTVHILKNHIDLFLKKCRLCQCIFTVGFFRRNFDQFNIGNRIDLVEKFLSKDKIVIYDDFDSYILEVANRIKKKLREVEYHDIQKKELCLVPKFLWTKLLEKHYYVEGPLYIDGDNNIIDIYPKYKTHKTKYLYFYSREKEPKFIYEISFKNQSYCILCDAYKKPKLFPPMCMTNDGYMETHKIHKGLYVCTKMCNALVYYYNVNILGDEPNGEEFDLNFKNFRYAKNRMMEFYTGCEDKGSSLALLENADLKRYIIYRFLDLLMFT
jgi:hypothetical protein